MQLALASDHAGRLLRLELAATLAADGHTVADHGTDSAAPVDYPEFAVRVARAVVGGDAELGILVCGTGLGMSIAANRVPGAYAALCTHEQMGRLARSHNHANILCLGERVVGAGLAQAICAAFLQARPEPGRHARRLGQVAELERR